MELLTSLIFVSGGWITQQNETHENSILFVLLFLWRSNLNNIEEDTMLSHMLLICYLSSRLYWDGNSGTRPSRANTQEAFFFLKKNVYPMPTKAPSDTAILYPHLLRSPIYRSLALSVHLALEPFQLRYFTSIISSCVFSSILFYVLSVNLLKFYHFICLGSP